MIVSIESIYSILASYISDYEIKLKNAIGDMSGQSADQIDQGTLLAIQAKVQTWGTIVATSTGILRAIGDALRTITQNIR